MFSFSKLLPLSNVSSYNRWRVFILRMRARIIFTLHAITLFWNFVQNNLDVILCAIIIKAWEVYLTIFNSNTR
jgi:hypothetical protein